MHSDRRFSSSTRRWLRHAGLLVTLAFTWLATDDGRAQSATATQSPTRTDHVAVPHETGLISGERAGTYRWIVRLAGPGRDFAALRAAIRSGVPQTVEAAVADLEATVTRERAEFVTTIESFGGRVAESWWIVDAMCVETSPEGADRLRNLTWVADVSPDRRISGTAMRPLIDATSVNGHNSDAAAANGFTGAGGRNAANRLSIAVLDSQLDSNYVTPPATRRHHQVLYQGGNLSLQTRVLQDVQMPGAVDFAAGSPGIPSDHGLSIATIAGGALASYVGSDNGQAPASQIVGINIANAVSGGIPYTTTAILDSAWQWVLANKVALNIVVAVNSFGGEPSPLSSTQVALDTCASVGDVLVVVPSANTGQFSSWDSQYAANGLAVGSAGPCAHNVSDFSARGPLTPSRTSGGSFPTPLGYERPYPDITAVGTLTVLASNVSETASRTYEGTSLSAPHVAGAGYLFRAGPDSGTTPTGRSALMTRAALLATALDIRSANGNPVKPDDLYGAGFLRTDYLTAYAQRMSLQTSESTVTNAVTSFPLNVTSGDVVSVAIAWFRNDFSATPNWSDFDLSVIDPAGTEVATSSSFVVGATAPGGKRRTWERATFTAATSGQFTIRVIPIQMPVAADRVALATCVMPSPSGFVTGARVEPVFPNVNANCTGTGPLVGAATLDTENLAIAPAKTFTTNDCASAPFCGLWAEDVGTRAFDILGGAAGQTVTFSFWVDAPCDGYMDCEVRDVSGSGNCPVPSVFPGPNVLGVGRAYYPAGGGYMSGQIAVVSGSPRFLVLHFPAKMRWWDDRFVSLSQWNAAPWFISSVCGNSTSPYWVWAPTAAGTWFELNNTPYQMLPGFVRIRQWKFRYGWAGAGATTANLTVTGVPRIGATVTLLLGGAGVGSTAGVLAMGYTPLSAPLLLPGSSTCNLLVTPTLTFPMNPSDEGWAEMPLSIPAQPSLIGGFVEVQSILVDVPSNTLWASNALRLVLGL